jgi:hypothetical protein
MSPWPLIARKDASRLLVKRRPGPLGVLIAVLFALLAGCGASDNGVASKPASEILAATTAAAQSASAVHVIASSKIMNGRPFKLDAILAKHRAHARVSLLGLSFEVIRDGDTLYVKGSQAFAARLRSVLGIKVPADKWLKSTTSTLAQLGSFTDMSKELPALLSGSGPVSKGARVKIDGRPAMTLKERRKLYIGTLYVATTGNPYPLKLTKTGREAGQTTFTDWNDPVTVTPPANAVDIAQLQYRKGH